jgi:P27 family predicted phage terminase small subunit
VKQLGKGRKARDIDTQTAEMSKEALAIRSEVKELFHGELKALKPSANLNANQRKIFRFIVDNIAKVGILNDVDTVLLENTCIAIDRLQSIEKMVNEDFSLIRDRELMATKGKYSTDFYKGVEYFGLSPSSRAKFGILVAQKREAESDPLLKILKKKA